MFFRLVHSFSRPLRFFSFAGFLVFLFMGMQISHFDENNFNGNRAICEQEKSPKLNRPKVIKLAELEAWWKRPTDTLYVFNFWATWCRPCIAELPYFEKIQREYADEKLKIVLISLDFVSNLDSLLVPFLERENIQSEVVLLDETKYNQWIDKIDPSWGGSIPATMMVRNSDNRRTFYEKEFESYEDLKNTINQNIIQKP